VTEPRGSTGAAVALFLAIAFSSSNVAVAQQPDAASATSGAALLNACRDVERMRNDAGTSQIGQGYCLGSVLAAALLLDRDKFCVPGPVPKLQLVRIVVNYLEKNPAKQSYELAILASWALSEAYPCPPGQRR
jgi:Ssp1 endopeptidase immunity protein Rap1a